MAYEEAKEFLARAVPWPVQTDPPEFFVNIHSPTTLPDGRRVYGGRAARTLNEAVRFVEYVANNSDVYVCMSAQRIGRAKTDKRGRAYWNAARSIQNAVWHKSFYVDVDVKAGGFPTTKIAGEALSDFCIKVDLPLPTFIVLSGSGGFHAHWVIDEPIPTSVWLPVAQGLVGAMRHHGFVVDYGCTIDAARILRVPETFNYKHDPPAPVRLVLSEAIYSLDRIASRVSQYTNINVIKIRSAPAVLNYRQNNIDLKISPLAAGLPFELMPNQHESLPSMREVRQVCPFVEHAHVSGGRDYRQPLWWETAKLAFYMREGVAALHTMARAHPDYKPAENDELYERVVRERTPVDQYGWPQCDTIMTQGSPVCANCQWMKNGAAHGKSPLNFLSGTGGAGSVTALQTVTAPVTDLMPEGYYQDTQLRIWKTGKVKDDGQEPDVLVCPYPFRNPLPVKGANPQILFEILDQEGWQTITVERKSLNDSRSFGSYAGDQGLALLDEQLPLMRRMLTSFAQMLRDRKINAIPQEPFGWSGTDGAPDAFCFNRTRFNCKGDTPSAIGDPLIQRWYEPKGSLEPWARAMKMINDQKRPELDMIVAAAFGAPFMEFTSERGLTISATSLESGIQKSTAMRTAAAIWGSQKTCRQVDDTGNAIVGQIGYLKNLPALWDEISSPKKAADMVKIIQALSQGQSKSRNSRASRQMEVNTWATILIVAGNHSLLAVAADESKDSPAGLYRVLEYPVTRRSGNVGYSEDAATIVNACNYNYGWAGVEVAKWCGANAALMPEMVGEAIHMFKKAIGGVDAERFWIAGSSCSLLGPRLANKLNLANIDIDALFAFQVRTIDSLRRMIEGSGSDLNRSDSLVEALMQFLTAHQGGIYMTEEFTAGQGRPRQALGNPTRQLYYNEYTPMIAHFAQRPNKLRVSKSVFKMWLKKEGRHPNSMLEQLRTRLAVVDLRAALAGGTPKAIPTGPVIELDLNLPELSDLLPK